MSRLSRVLAVGWEAQRKQEAVFRSMQLQGENTAVILDDTNLDADALSNIFSHLTIADSRFFSVRLRKTVEYMLRFEKVSNRTKDVINAMWERIAERFYIPAVLPTLNNGYFTLANANAEPEEQLGDEVQRSEYEEDQEAEYQAAVAARDAQLAAWDVRRRVIQWTRLTTRRQIVSEEEGEEEEADEPEDESGGEGDNNQDTPADRYRELTIALETLTKQRLAIMEDMCKQQLEASGGPTEEAQKQMDGLWECLQFLAHHNDLFHTDETSVPLLLIPAIMKVALNCRPFPTTQFNKLATTLSENNRKHGLIGPSLDRAVCRRILLMAAMKGSLEALTRLLTEMPTPTHDVINRSIVLLTRANPMPHDSSKDWIPYDTREEVLRILSRLPNWELGDRFQVARNLLQQEGTGRVWLAINDFHLFVQDGDDVMYDLMFTLHGTATHGLNYLVHLINRDTNIAHDTSNFVELFANEWLRRLGIAVWSASDVNPSARNVLKNGKLSMLKVLFKLPWDIPATFFEFIVENLKHAAVRTDDNGEMFQWLLANDNIRGHRADVEAISNTIVYTGTFVIRNEMGRNQRGILLRNIRSLKALLYNKVQDPQLSFNEYVRQRIYFDKIVRNTQPHSNSSVVLREVRSVLLDA